MRVGEAVLKPLLGGHAQIELIALAEAVEHLEGDFPAGLRLAHAVARVRGVAGIAHADGHGGSHGVVVLDAGGDGEREIGEQRVVLHPLVVGDEELDLVAPDGVLELEAAVPAVHVAGLFRPQHVHGRQAQRLGGCGKARTLGHGPQARDSCRRRPRPRRLKPLSRGRARRLR